MTGKQKKITISALIVFVLMGVIAIAATLYPYTVISVSGIQMTVNNSTSTTQGFVDVTLKNVNATCMSFCLDYDESLIQLSNVSDNVPIQNKTIISPSPVIPNTSFNVEHTFFEQNTDAFPEGSFKDYSDLPIVSVNAPVIGIADADAGYLAMNFFPEEDKAGASPYIDNLTKSDVTQVNILADSPDGVRIGRISFNIIDPVAFSQLTHEQLDEVIKVVPFDEMINKQIPGVSQLDDDGVYVGYMDNDGDIQWHTRADKNMKFDIKIKPDLVDVRPQAEEITVSSYEIFNQGTIDDLLDYINEKASVITLYYADQSEVPAVFKWDQNSNISTMSWDPKGGEYTIVQQYNDDFNVSVKVHVTPVTLKDFSFDNKELTYLYGADGFPESFEQLNLPQKVHPVLDTYIPNAGIPEVSIEYFSLQGGTGQITTLPDGFDSGDPGKFVFMGHFGISSITLFDDYPWLTVNNPLPDVEIIRNVVTDPDDMPKELVVESAVTDENGVLTIVVKNKDETDIQDGAIFDIKMPGGETIDKDLLGDRYTVVIADGKATITINPDINIPDEKKLAQLVNMGDRAGNFEIASKESPDKPMGPYTPFAPAPRKNLYTGPEGETVYNYQFDYSLSLAAMFPVKAGNLPSTTLTLLRSSDRIATTYSGYDGTMPGQLASFTVDGWTVVSGDMSEAGSIVTIEGTLSDTSYTNYGKVNNDADNVTVTIKYCVVPNDDIEEIDPIDDFVFDTKQVGYDYNDLQTKAFTVKNTGQTDIHGLSAVISISSVNDGEAYREAFLVTKTLPQILPNGESIDFDITTKIGLPEGIYVSTVYIVSNNGVLRTFKITFKVTSKPVYKIDIKENDSSFGKAKTQSETYTSEAGEVITIIAEPEDDCKFIEWTTTSPDVTFTDASNATTTFEMPASDVEIVANFEETLGAKLRATELYVKSTLDIDQQLNDENWNKIDFDPVKREYYVVVPNDMEQVKLWFKPRPEAETAAMELTHNRSSNPILIAKDATDEFYKSVPIDLDISPDENLITLSFTASDPTEGDVTRSYKIHVYRKLKVSELVKFEYGNSPYGLIMRDASIDKDAAKQAFTDNGNTFTAGNTPDGGTEGVTYTPDAWSGVNYDLDETALFVINSNGFIDPGYKEIKNSIGQEVTTVSKKVTVQVLAETTASLQNGSSDDFTYISPLTISLPDSGQITQLSDKRIRPDRYEIKYSFTDFDGKTVSVSKPLIVLSPLGDVNVDNVSNGTDVSRVLHRFSVDLADNTNVPGYDYGGRLFKLRVCDVNKDGNVNAIDANYIRANVLYPFYKNLS